MAAVSGLRERKKRRTRELIVRVAGEQFLRGGFDATTIADIAAAAEISPRTFFGYFATKEDVVFHDHDAHLADLAARLRERAAGRTAFDVLREWILEMDERRVLDSPEETARRRMIRATPALEARYRANLAELESLLATAVADDLGTGPESLRPHLVAAAAIAALDALGRRTEADARTGRPAAEVLDEALTFLDGGLEAFRARP